MAKVTFKLGDYANKLVKLRSEYEEVAKKAVYEGASIVANEIRNNLENVVSDEATGELLNSLGISPIQRDKVGNFNAKVGFSGYDFKGVPNQLKARVLESGSSKQKKRPFVRPAISNTKSRVEKAMYRVVDEAVKKIMD